MEYLAPSGVDHLPDRSSGGTGQALISLAMIICADIEMGMIFLVIPFFIFYEFSILLTLLFIEHRIQVRHQFWNRSYAVRSLYLMFIRTMHLGHQPGTRDHSVCLEELLRGRSTHLRRNHAEKIILDSDDVYGGQHSLLDNDLEGAGECLIFLSFPMEVLSDCDTVEYERGFGKLCGQGLRIKVEFVVQGTVIYYLALTELSLSRTGTIGKDFEFYLRSRHNTHIYSLLRTLQAPDQRAFLIFGYAHFIQHIRQKLRVYLMVFLLNRYNEDACHICTAGTHRKVVRAIAEIVMRTMAATEYHDRTELAISIV